MCSAKTHGPNSTTANSHYPVILSEAVFFFLLSKEKSVEIIACGLLHCDKERLG